MGPDGKLSDYDITVIVEHCERLIAWCNNALDGMRSIPEKYRDEKFERQQAYWKNARSALKWTIAHAKQRRRKKPYGNVRRI